MRHGMFANDLAMPGFQNAFDMAMVQDAIERAFPDAGAVQDCAIERFRYRAGARATFQYSVTYSGRETWLTGTLWPGAKARKTFERSDVHDGLGYDPGIGMLLEKFPRDAKLPYLGRFVDEAGGIVSEALQLDVQVDRGDIKLVRYRPHVGCVFKLRANVDDSPRNLYVKFYADEDIDTVCKTLSAAPSGKCYNLLRPLGMSRERRFIVWPELSGVSLGQMIGANDSDGAIECAAKALAEFHQSASNLPQVSPRATVAADTEKARRFISTLIPEFGQAMQECAQRILLQFGDEPLSPYHHDMKPEHILLNGSRGQLIDVEGIACGDPALDIGNMIARIGALSYVEGLDAHLCHQAADKFRRHSVPVDEAKLAAAIALGKLKLAVFAISHQVEGWLQIARREVLGAAELVAAPSACVLTALPRQTPVSQSGLNQNL